MVKIIDGKKIAENIKDEIVSEILNIKGGYACPAERPNLAILLVGDRKDSEIYVNLKEKEAKKVGIDTHLYKFSKDASEKEIEDTITFLNNDSSINAILLQLPLPENFDTDKLIASIDPEKDVDRFHPSNLEKLSLGCDFRDDTVPPLLQVIFEILEDVKIEPRGKIVCAIVNSDILGNSIKRILECRGADVNICRASDANLKEKTSQADILISAVGKPGIIKKEFIKEGSCLIDIGITKEGDKVVGDIDFLDVQEKAGFITPVPGGVGPITIATALRNTLSLYKKNKCE